MINKIIDCYDFDCFTPKKLTKDFFLKIIIQIIIVIQIFLTLLINLNVYFPLINIQDLLLDVTVSVGITILIGFICLKMCSEHKKKNSLISYVKKVSEDYNKAVR